MLFESHLTSENSSTQKQETNFCWETTTTSWTTTWRLCPHWVFCLHLCQLVCHRHRFSITCCLNPRGNTQGKRCAAEAFLKPCPVKDATCITGYCFRVFQACEGKREVSKECQTHLTGEGAEKVTTYFFCAFPLRPCLALLAHFTLAFAGFCSSEKGEKITPVMQAIKDGTVFHAPYSFCDTCCTELSSFNQHHRIIKKRLVPQMWTAYLRPSPSLKSFRYSPWYENQTLSLPPSLGHSIQSQPVASLQLPVFPSVTCSSPKIHLVYPQNFALFSISLGTSATIPRRNEKQKLCKILGGK